MTDITPLSSIDRPLPGTYAEFVKALKKPGEAILATLTAQQIDLVHMAIGLSGEVGELVEPFWLNEDDREKLIDRANIVEELGDIEFFIEGICANLDWERGHTDSLSVVDSRAELLNAMTVYSADILDIVKRNAIYGKDLDREALANKLSDFEFALSDFYEVVGVNRAEVITHNVEKLAKRYASLNYSDAQAQARADKA